MEILLNRAKNIKNTDADSHIVVGLEEEARPLAEEQIVKNINEYEQYVKEKDACTKYRLSFTVTPICSNILFNKVSEIVYHEGGDDCIEIGSASSEKPETIESVKSYHRNYLNVNKRKIDRYQAIRDTSYSSSKIGPFVYHCGYDIFNNHFLRQKEFAVVGKVANGQTESDFNTLKDYVRNKDGYRVKEKRIDFGQTGATREKHLYQFDTVKTFSETVREKLIEDENGWWGFLNTATMPVKNFYEETFNRTMCNNKVCEQYDMYPDRSLYSFLPKYNKYRDRYEHNWKFFLTYPYSSMMNDAVYDDTVKEEGLKAYLIDEINKTEEYEYNKAVLFRSDVFHNLGRNSQIEIIVINDGQAEHAITNVIAIGNNVGGDTAHYFSIPYEDIKEYTLNNTTEYRFRKIVNGGLCHYYFRVFKKIPYNRNGETVDFTPVVNKLGFSHSYFGDENVELLFNRDVDVSGLTDNLGRELSEIYLTAIKNNTGYKTWYEDKDKTNSKIEFSHCFGKISSGMDLMPEANDYNVHKVHNVVENVGCTEKEIERLQIPDTGKTLENEITSENSLFLGDLVEFSPYTVKETILEYVYHRFNTVQREYTKDKEYHDIYHEEIETDDDDVTTLGMATFATKKSLYNTVDGTDENTFPANIDPEGYYYNPHYQIKLKEYGSQVQQGSDIKLIFIGDSLEYDDNRTRCSGTLSKNYMLSKGDSIYALVNGEKILCNVENNPFDEKNSISIKISDGGKTFPTSGKILFFKNNPIKPSGSYELNDGTGRYLWRDMLSEKEITQDSDLYNSVFTNGAVYKHRSLNFYLRRQDPTGEYGLSPILKTGLPQHYTEMGTAGSVNDYKRVEYISENTTETC